MLVPETDGLFRRVEPIIELETLDGPVASPNFIVHRTGPQTALAPDGARYFVKGQSDQVTFAEVAGLRLARSVGMCVPSAALCAFNGNIYAGSLEVECPVRNVEPFLGAPHLVENHSILYEVIAVDTWLANDDRNMGNVVGSQVGFGRVALTMIDFEGSKTLRELPTLTVANVRPRSLWPKEDLGRALRPSRPSYRNLEMIEKIRVVTRENLTGILSPIAQQIPSVTWCDGSIDVLFNRAQQIQQLVEEVWDAS